MTMYSGDEFYGDDITSGLSGYEEDWMDEDQAAFEAAQKPSVEICPECNEPIINGNPKGHKEGCKTNKDVEF
jgi:hypothetical protein